MGRLGRTGRSRGTRILTKELPRAAKEAAVHAPDGPRQPCRCLAEPFEAGAVLPSSPPAIFAIDPSERAGGRIDAVCLASAVCCRSLEGTRLEEHLRDVLTHNRYKTQFALNIDRLRRECGWSFNGLSKASGIDKGAILRHIHAGSRAKPRTVRRPPRHSAGSFVGSSHPTISCVE